MAFDSGFKMALHVFQALLKRFSKKISGLRDRPNTKRDLVAMQARELRTAGCKCSAK
jgi:hypothetical protein